MGKVVTDVLIRNADDVRRAGRSEIADSAIREVLLEHVLCDSGATVLCLPAEVIRSLGLPMLEEVVAATATGTVAARIFEDARITIAGRTRTVECLELPGGLQPLLGVIPMEQLGLELDLQNQRLIVLPHTGDNTYLTIL